MKHVQCRRAERRGPEPAHGAHRASETGGGAESTAADGWRVQQIGQEEEGLATTSMVATALSLVTILEMIGEIQS